MLRRLDLTVLRPLATLVGGVERSLQRGPGPELSEIREYQPGDDVRHIAWSITARTDRPYVREAYAERALDVWLMLDLSASLDWGTARCLKRDRAVELAGLVGQLLGRHGNRIGALPFAERSLGVIPPTAGRRHLLDLLRKLTTEPSRAGAGRTDLAGALRFANTLLRRRSFILLASDFLVADGWQVELGKLAHRHEVVAVVLRDPREAELPDVGLITLEDPETGGQMIVDTGDRKLRERYRLAAAAQADRLRTDLAARGVDQLPLSTDADLLPALVAFLKARKHRKLRVSGLQSPVSSSSPCRAASGREPGRARRDAVDPKAKPKDWRLETGGGQPATGVKR